MHPAPRRGAAAVISGRSASLDVKDETIDLRTTLPGSGRRSTFVRRVPGGAARDTAKHLPATTVAPNVSAILRAREPGLGRSKLCAVGPPPY